MRTAQVVFAAGLVLVGLVLLREASQMPTGWTPAGPGPGFFPFWLAAGFTLSAAVVAARTRAAPRSEEPFFPPGAAKRILVVFAPMLAVVALLPYLGLYLGGAVYLGGYARLVGRHPWGLVLAIAVGVPATLFLIFESWFRLPIPKGILLEWLLYGRQ